MYEVVADRDRILSVDPFIEVFITGRLDKNTRFSAFFAVVVGSVEYSEKKSIKKSERAISGDICIIRALIK
jgi:hypothetical protein